MKYRIPDSDRDHLNSEAHIFNGGMSGGFGSSVGKKPTP